MRDTMPLPVHYQPEKVSEVWKVDYQAIAAAAEDWQREHQLHPAGQDEYHGHSQTQQPLDIDPPWRRGD